MIVRTITHSRRAKIKKVFELLNKLPNKQKNFEIGEIPIEFVDDLNCVFTRSILSVRNKDNCITFGVGEYYGKGIDVDDNTYDYIISELNKEVEKLTLNS